MRVNTPKDMNHPRLERGKSRPETNLLSNPKFHPKWIPRILASKYSWKILSGRWDIETPGRIIYLKQPRLKTGENISLIGSNDWADLKFNVRFKILTESVKPPEGGVILYFHYKNIKNFYSFHFCLSKQKIELIKRHRGVWSTILKQRYELSVQKEYRVIVKTVSGTHQCKVNGNHLAESRDKDISKGCIGIGVKYCDSEFNHVSVDLV